VFAAVGVRLVHLQVIAPDDHAERGVAQRVRTVALPAERGSIFDRNGNELALSVRQHAVWADPALVGDPAGHAAALAPVLGVERSELHRRLTAEGSRFVYLARQVEDDVADQVSGLDLDGVDLLDEPRRVRPAGDLAAAVLGDVDPDNRGVSGLELEHQERLAGTPGELLLERGADGRTIAAGERRLSPPTRGDDLVLTIDRSLQYHVEQALAGQVAGTDARGGMAVAMDPDSGEILAMASIGRDGEGEPRPTAHNAALTSVFEPGSVSKVLTLSAVLEEGLRAPADVLTVPDTLQVGPKQFSDSERHEPLPLTVTDILATSSNVGTIMLAQQLGMERMDDYLRRFGLGQPTGLGFPGESGGILPDPEEASSTSIGSVSIGQGLAVNAVQMLAAVNVVANGGTYVQPTLVRSVVDGSGTEHPAPAAPRHQAVSPETAGEMKAMMARAVSDGTGVNAQVAGYEVAGKTGTARKPSTSFRGYEPGAYMAVFAGFVPAQKPELSLIVVLDEPHPYYGGIVAAPVFADIAEYALRLFRVPPPPEVEVASVPPAGMPPSGGALPRD
jgi:cell division protein FtsI (penicillin-binding protein 3)